MSIAINNLKIGNKYTCTNYDDIIDFEVMDISSQNEMLCKDLHTMEKFILQNFLAFGISDNYDLTEFKK